MAARSLFLLFFFLDLEELVLVVVALGMAGAVHDVPVEATVLGVDVAVMGSEAGIGSGV